MVNSNLSINTGGTSNSYVDNSGWGTNDFYQDWMKQQPYIGDALPPYSPYLEPKIYGPSPSRSSDYFDQQAILDQISKLESPKKSAFEELIDQIFTTTEKEQFLIDAGYELIHNPIETTITRKLSDGTVKTITNSLDELFLKEITVKFKNLLLAKATLKLKL